MMRVCKLVSGLFCMITMLAAGTAWADPASPQMTSDQAILIARDFCQKIGAPVSGPATAKYPTSPSPRHQPAEPDEYWLPRWHVESFDGWTNIDVVDGTGVVQSCFRSSPMLLTKGANEQALSEEAAVTTAEAALRASGVSPDELGDMTASLGYAYRDDPGIWLISWQRVYHGVPYEDQAARVSVQAQSGVVLGLTLDFPSPPANPSKIHLTARDGAEKALARLAQRGVQTALIYQEDAEYVVPDETQPNGAPTVDAVAPAESQPNGTIHTGASPTDFVVPRLAWIARAMTDEAPMDEWIDAETGDVIGETTHLFAGHAAPPKGRKTAAAIVSDAKDITIERRTDKYAWPKKPTATISATSQPKVFKLLQASQPSPMNHLMVAPKFQLVVTTSDKRPTTLYYLPDRNLVGNGVDWLTPPAGFQKWMEKLGGKGDQE